MSQQEVPDLGTRMRELRSERGLSLRALAELSDLSPNTISLIERGETSPSVSTLQRLATALGVPVHSFFMDPGERVQLILTRADERTRSGSASVMLESLGFGLEGQTCDPFIVTLKPGANSGRRMMSHPGTELIFCIDGTLEIEVGGDEFRLVPGDALLYRAERPHRWRNPNRHSAVFIMMTQTTGERHDAMDQHLHP